MTEIQQPTPEHELRSFKASIADGQYVEVAQRKTPEGTIMSVLENDQTGKRLETPQTLVEVAKGIEERDGNVSPAVNLMGRNAMYAAAFDLKPIATVDELLGRQKPAVQDFDPDITIPVADQAETPELPSLLVDSKDTETTKEVPSDEEIKDIQNRADALAQSILDVTQQAPHTQVIDALQNNRFGSEVETLQHIFSPHGRVDRGSVERVLQMLYGNGGSKLTVNGLETFMQAVSPVKRELTAYSQDLQAMKSRLNDGNELSSPQQSANTANIFLLAADVMTRALKDLQFNAHGYIDLRDPRMLEHTLNSMKRSYGAFMEARQRFNGARDALTKQVNQADRSEA